MLWKRRAGVPTSSVLLFSGILVALSADLDLYCTNDLRTMSCEYKAQNCTEYNMTLRGEQMHEEELFIFKQCDSQLCCCSTEMTLVFGDTHNATIWKGSESVASKIISVTGSIKPRTPTIQSVKVSNGNVQVTWTTNMDETFLDLMADVTYFIKGDTVKESEHFKPTTLNGLCYYEILGRKLKSSRTYVVIVRSYYNKSKLYSDDSKEWEIETFLSNDALLRAIAVLVSIGAVIISGVICFCFVKIKTKWQDTIANCPNPKLLIVVPSEQKFLKPWLPHISSISVEPLVVDEIKLGTNGSVSDTSSGSQMHSNESSTGSCPVIYAVTEPIDIIAGVQGALSKAFANISPVSSLITKPPTESNKGSGSFSFPTNLCGVRAADMNPGSFSFDNKTYSIIIPGIPQQIVPINSLVQTQAEMLCDSAYHPSEDYTCQQVQACTLVDLPPVDSSAMQTDMSYQQCNADSGQYLNAEDYSLSSVSSDLCRTQEAGCESPDKLNSGATELNVVLEEATICDENSCNNFVPKDTGFPSVDDDYQPFQIVVEQPDILFSVKGNQLSNCSELSDTKMPQSLINPVMPGFTYNAQDSKCLSELQMCFPYSIYDGKSVPVTSDSDYQSL